MADVTVEVAGRGYRLGCADGEEGHLRALAAALDEEARRIASGMKAPPEENRLLLMTALMLADRLAEVGADARGDDARLAEAEAALAERVADLTAAEGRMTALIEAQEAAEEAREAAEARAGALEQALVSARDESRALRDALEDAATAPDAPDLFAGQGGGNGTGGDDERARRIAAIAERIEHLTEQISLHLAAD